MSAPLKVFVAERCLSRDRRWSRTVDAIAGAGEHGFDGIELSERSLDRSEAGLAAAARALGSAELGAILDGGFDFTIPDDRARADEVRGAVELLRAGVAIGARIVRLTVGGQAMSIQRLWRGSTRRSTGRTHDAAGRSAMRSVLAHPLVTAIAHGVRRSLPAPRRGIVPKSERAAECVRTVAASPDRAGIPLAIENHWGITADPAEVVRLVDRVAHADVGVCADFDNVPRGVSPYDALAILAPRAILVHAKSRTFDAAGEESNLDYRRCFGILRDAGFDGIVTIEYEGAGDPMDGARRTLELVRRHAGAAP